MKILTILSILTITGSLFGCVSTPTYAPLCPPDRPYLTPISSEVLTQVDPILVGIVASNDLKLKSHIKLLEELIIEHNNQLGVSCDEED